MINSNEQTVIGHLNDLICAKLQDTKQGTKYAKDKRERKRKEEGEKGERVERRKGERVEG